MDVLHPHDRAGQPIETLIFQREIQNEESKHVQNRHRQDHRQEEFLCIGFYQLQGGCRGFQELEEIRPLRLIDNYTLLERVLKLGQGGQVALCQSRCKSGDLI